MSSEDEAQIKFWEQVGELSQDSKLAKTNKYSKYNYKEFLRHGICM